MQPEEKIKSEWKRFILLVTFVFAIFVIIIYITTKNRKEEPGQEDTEFEISGIEYGFIYYDGNIYYKNPNVIIYDLSKVKLLGTNQKHIKKSDVVDNKIKFNNEEICVYAEYLDKEVYAYEGNENILLIKSEYAINDYFVYIKDLAPSQEAYKNLQYYIDNKNYCDSIMLISYGMQQVNIDFSLDSLEKSNNTPMYSSSIEEGKMIYYLMFEENNVYYIFKGEGNILSDMIFFESRDEKNSIYYLKYDGLSDILLDTYADFFGIEKNIETVTDATETNMQNNTTDSEQNPSDSEQYEGNTEQSLYKKQDNLNELN